MTTLPRRHLLDAVTSSPGDYIRLEVDASSLCIVGNDDKTTTATWLSCDAPTTPSQITVPSRLLAATLKGLPGDDVEIEVTSRLRLRSGSAVAEVEPLGRCVAVQQVPEACWRDVDVEAASKLSNAISRVVIAALNDPARPVVSGIRFDDGVVVAQDGARLHVVAVEHGFGTLTLPHGCCGVVAEALKVEAATPVKAKGKKGVVAVDTSPTPRHRVAVGANFVAVEVTTPSQQRLVICRKAPEPYAQWRSVLEGLGDDGVVVIKRDVIVAALKGCPADAVTLRWDASTPFRFDYVVTDDTGTRRLGSGGATVEVVRQQGAAAVKVSCRYLLDAVKCCGDEVTLSTATGQPLRVRGDDFDGVVMWMR